MPSHTRRREGVYYTRLVVPPRLRAIIGKSDLGRSLGTKSLAEAKRLQPVWLSEALAIIDAAEMELFRQVAPIVTVPPLAIPEDELEYRWAQAWELAAEDDADERLSLPEADLSSTEAATARLLKRARRERDDYRGRYYERKRRSRQTSITGATAGEAQPDNGMLLDPNIVDLWAAERKPRPKTIDAHRAVVRWFYERVGSKPVDKITKADVLAFKSKLVAEGQSEANIKTKLDRVRTLLQWATDNGHAETNVAAGVTIKITPRLKRRPFDLTSLNAIFGSPVYTHGERPAKGRGEAAYWLPLLALFTGARMEELGQLRPEDVQRLAFPDADGNEQTAWFLHLIEVGKDDNADDDGTKLKNEDSERLVPIHSELERLGFIAFALAMKEQGKLRLFHELPPNKYGTLTAKWGEWWSGYRRDVCGITDRRMVFHSFRHTFKDYARHAGIAEGVQRQMMGHSSDDVADDYGSGYSLFRVTEGMKLYKVPGLKLPA